MGVQTRNPVVVSGLRRIAALVLAVGLAVPQAAWASCDPRGEVWGFCLNTLPRLQCCSPAAVTWSQIVVGHRFPVSGVVNPDSYSSAGSSRKAGEAMDIIFPSGKRVALPLDEKGRFGRTITFDEEGSYRLRVPSNGGEVGFRVAYRVTPLNAPTVDTLFGSHHRTSGNTVVALPFGRPTSLRVRFTDATGRSVANHTIMPETDVGPVMTDADGVAVITHTARGIYGGYDLVRLYPGLVAQTYREVHMEGGNLKGLPGGDMRGIRREGGSPGGEFVFPLREFLAKAYPWGFDPETSGTRIEWDAKSRTVRMGDLALMIDTGQVLKGRDEVLTVAVTIHNDRVHLDKRDLARLFDLMAWAKVTPEGVLLLSAAELP